MATVALSAVTRHRRPRPTLVGAGDCLTGWLAAGLTGGLAIGPALDRAVLAASVAVQRSGAAAAVLTAAEVDARR